ncbi:RND transporter [Nostoc linckia z18]|uniref:RND transporter n=3 Tax=Nostoc linckia TaxID=92942 RepID=A0A9Q5Z6K5_NOSLI|nr:RND transporter [Nostoc linckia z1]PHJ71975.1 RND transporter [Nostoc linckia z3]PHJ77943.1 RND transporter [Nostoc linckia z2]PHJ81398.1 RND transporter [Nostoc linckia z6]PHJ84721.1 RND transporter [Nostoc linckia z4]PHJ95850.1 RND transporter [Nostoc linckia z7]PHJ96220.1 RND transporter [Nostoc linckia z8]PHK08132.1 RND transporter [Nostoc linckia z9]PHK16618.1 RND transporter [Nostoc linckia z13]PHK17233.1 RND transporter [Nostoc linckia z14]PHK30741.1 RND transporter [Nostoc linc
MRCFISIKTKTPVFLVTQMIPRLFGLIPRGRLWLVILGLTYLCSACNASEAQSSGKQAGKKRAVPVVVTTATQKTIPIQLSATGTVEAYSTVSVKSQVGGQLTGVYFQQGQNVKKGDLLFKIDSRSLEAALMQANAAKAKDLAQVKQAQANVTKAIAQVNQAKANVAKDVAQATNADVQAKRYNSLLKEGAISKEQADQFQTTADAQRATVNADRNGVADAQAAVAAAQADVQNAQAAVVADEAAIANAKIQLSYSSIYSPITGRTGSLKLDRGNLVEANATDPLITISQIRPIYVTFSIPQRLLPDLKKYSANGKLEVIAIPPKDTGRPIRGELTFVDSGLNTQTGTIQLKATFTNTDERLVPGQFVNVVLKLTEERNVITVPSQAVQTGQQGQFVFVVKPDKTVEMRPITVGDTIGNQTAIKQGLQPGEQIVTDGQFNLVPGATVQVKPEVGGKAGGQGAGGRGENNNS